MEKRLAMSEMFAQRTLENGDMKYKCKECGYQSTIISGTLLQRSHLPISKWLRSAWYIANETGCANALKMQNMIDLGSYRTALSVLNKLRKAISRCEKPKLKGTVIVDDVYIKSDNDGFSYHTFIAVEIKKNGYGQIRMEGKDYVVQDGDIMLFRFNV